MVTRSSLPTRLAEGRIYNVALPREEMRLGRSAVLRGPALEQQYQVLGGVPVPVGEPKRVEGSAGKKVVVGSIVSLSSGRASYISVNAELSMALYGEANRTGSHVRVPSYDNYGKLYVVTGVSSDGKLFSVVKLWEPYRYDARLIVDSGAGTVGIRGGDTVAEVRSNTRRTVVSEMVSHSTMTLARSSHIRGVFSPSALPPTLLEYIKSEAKGRIADAMYQRLADLANAPLENYRAVQILDHLRHDNRLTRVVRWASKGKFIARQLSRAAKYAAAGARSRALEPLNNAHTTLSEVCRTNVDTIVNDYAKRIGLGDLSRAGCGHWHEGSATTLVLDRYGRTDTYCPACTSSFGVSAVLDDGTTAMVHNSNHLHDWSDGTRRMAREPGVIGGRHSGKGIVGFIEPRVKREIGSYPTLGLELEMQAYNNTPREVVVREMRNRLANVLSPQELRRYVHFEEDGSTGIGGVEMVTGYTDLHTHNMLLKKLLCTDEGKPAWAGRLRSHDASGQSCGIHVHIQKPKSLIHASRMRYFINAAATKELITDVARRYNVHYAKINNSLTAASPERAASAQLKNFKGYDTRATKETQTRALNRFNTDRYEALNFQNPRTVEFRLYRGSMMHETVMACMELTQAVYEYTQFRTAGMPTVAGFIDFINAADQASTTKNLRNYLHKKGWSEVRVAKVRKEKLEAETAELAI